MPAIDNKHLINIVAVNVDEGVSKKSGLPWKMHKAQCVVTGPDGKTQIGELMLPRSLAETAPGKYLAEFQLAVSYERTIIPQIVALHPYNVEKTVSPKEAAAIK